MKLSYLLIGAFFCFSWNLSGQVRLDYLNKRNRTPVLQKMAAELSTSDKIQRQIALRKARQNNWSTENLMMLDENENPIYVKPTNFEAGTLTQSVLTRSIHGVEGSGMRIGMWEAFENGAADPRTTHQDFQKNNLSRITQKNSSTGLSLHATHVAGTLIGNPPGASNLSLGMAPNAHLDAYDVSNHLSEMASAAQSMLVSNHSYGIVSGYNLDRIIAGPGGTSVLYKEWTWYGGSAQFISGGDDPAFGNYGYANIAKSLDAILTQAPFYLPVFAAGNDHNDNPRITIRISANDRIRDGENGTYVNIDPSKHPRGDGTQSSNIAGFGCATNVLTVANMTKNLGIHESSSRGAMDDGRIKPDLCGIGTDVYSAANAGDGAYATLTGTSMASPNVAGSLLLLQELYERQNGSIGRYMLASQLKGLAIHTAVDQGNPGPDYTYGWGLLDTEEAAELIDLDSWSRGFSAASIIEDGLTPNNLEDEFIFNFAGTIKITLCYTDPVDANSSKALQNDLDITLTSLDNNQVYYPYVLDPNNSSNVAATGDNNVDNVEQIYIAGSEANPGLYRLKVKLDSTQLFNGQSQFYSLIVSGINWFCQYDISHRNFHQLPSATYAAQNQITSETVIDVSKNITYEFGERTILKRGFHAKSGSTFKAMRGTCPF